MSELLQVCLLAPFPVEDVAARVELEGGKSVFVLLKDGCFTGELPAKPRKIVLTLAPVAQSDLLPSSSTEKIEGERTPAGIKDLFETGLPIPPSGRLIAEIRWGAACHSDQLPAMGESVRFASPEHIACGRWVGKVKVGSDSPLQFCGITATFDATAGLPVNGKEIGFGEVVCLAGDFYAHLDDAAVKTFAWAWPGVGGITGWLGGDYRKHTLSADSASAVKELLKVITTSSPDGFVNMAFDVVKHHFPARRYLALASQNFCHFACPQPGPPADGNPALRLYRAYHERAIAAARAASAAANQERALLSALAVDAFGCHFLTDLFATGHIRVPRKLLAEKYGVLRGSLKMCKDMHEEDNVRGLWVRPSAPQEKAIVWRAFGDGMLSRAESDIHRQQAQEAVRRSSAEVFAAYCAGVSAQPQPQVASAEELIPVPLEPGQHPSVTEQLPNGDPVPADAVNHWPLYWFDAAGAIVRRITPASEMNVEYRYVDQPGKSFAYEATV